MGRAFEALGGSGARGLGGLSGRVQEARNNGIEVRSYKGVSMRLHKMVNQYDLTDLMKKIMTTAQPPHHTTGSTTAQETRRNSILMRLSVVLRVHIDNIISSIPWKSMGLLWVDGSRNPYIGPGD